MRSGLPHFGHALSLTSPLAGGRLAPRLARSFDERLPEVAHHLVPLLAALLDLVELVLHARGEVHVEDVGEAARPAARLTAMPRSVGREPPAVALDVVARGDGADDGGVGAGPADALLLERLDQRGLGVARRRLGEVLLGPHRHLRRRCDRLLRHGEREPGRQLGQARAVLLVVLVEAVELLEAGELEHAPGGAQPEPARRRSRPWSPGTRRPPSARPRRASRSGRRA